MKFLSTIAFLFLSFSLFAQSITLYGLKAQGTSNPDGQIYPLDIVQIDPFTADITTLFEVENSFAIASGSSTFDHENGTLIYYGTDNQQNYSIFSADVTDQNSQSNPSTTAHAIELEFDLETGTTYGLSYDTENELQRIVSIDLMDGSTTVVASLPDISAIAIGSTTFDTNGKRYIFYGVDQSGNNKLVAVNVETGEMTSNPIINAPETPRINFFEYDNKEDRLFSLYTIEDPTLFDPLNQMAYYNTYFAEINIETGEATLMNASPILSGYYAGVQVGGVAYDQASQTYILRGSNDNGFVLMAINASTGEVLSETPSTEIISEIQVDNINFSREFYNVSSVKNNALTSSINVFPNPTINEIEINVELDQTEIIEIEILDVLGRLLILKSGQSNSNINIPTSDLNAGTYYIRIKDTEGNKGIRSFTKL